MVSVTLRGDDVQSFDTRSNVSSGRIMESFYQKRICESDQLKTLLVLYDQDVEQKDLQTTLPEIQIHGDEIFRSEVEDCQF